jgi:hypothetical protein
MPLKKKPAKRRGQRNNAISQRIISFNPGLYGQPLPQRFRTALWCEGDYKIPIATASTTSGVLSMNLLNLPFYPGGSSAFPSYTFLGPATEATLQPTGYSQLAGVTGPGLYNTLKIRRATIKIRWNGSNSGNNVVLTVVPSLNTNTFASVYSARTAPFARQATFSVSKPNTGVDRDGWFTYTVDPYRIIGLDRIEEKADTFLLVPSAAVTSSYGLQWFVILQSNDLDVSSTTASLFQVRLHWDVEFYQLNQMKNV